MIGGWKKAAVFVVSCLLNPLIYFYAPWYYTGTVSIPFLMAGIYYAYKFCAGKKYRHLCIAVLWFYLGIRIRVTTGIAVIALLVYGVIYALRQKNINAKKVCRDVSVMAAVLLLIFLGCRMAENKYIRLDYEDSAYPAVHWIMMASHGEGGYDAEDCRYTESFPTKAQKTRADVERWKEYLEETSFTEKCQLALKKMSVTWAVGNDAMQDDLERCEHYGRLYEYVSGNNRNIMEALLQAARVVTLLFMFAGIIGMRKKHCPEFSYVNYLTVTGGITFYIFWEAGAEYSISFFLLMIMLQTDGIELLESKVPQKKVRLEIIPLACLVAQGLILVCLKFMGSFVVEKYYYYAAIQANYEDEQVLDLQASDWCGQTFYADRNFSKIGVKCYNMDEECRDAAYEVRLERDGEILASEVLLGDSLYGKDYWKMAVGDQSPGNYEIIIENMHSDEKNKVLFCNAGTENVDMYKRGSLLKNGTDMNGDLSFMHMRRKM